MRELSRCAIIGAGCDAVGCPTEGSLLAAPTADNSPRRDAVFA
jgi:hypothetical protein